MVQFFWKKIRSNDSKPKVSYKDVHNSISVGKNF